MRVVKLEGRSLADDIASGTQIVMNELRRCMDVTTAEEEWQVEVIDVPADGSCFFQSIATAMDDNIEAWFDIEELRVPMEKYWEEYTEGVEDKYGGVTSHLVRHMCAENIDDDILEKYNVEAEYRTETLKEKGVMKYKNIEQFKSHVLKRNTWGDHASFTAFLKSLNYRCGLVVFDPECQGIKYLPPEWTVEKSLYIFLLRKVNHYSVLRLQKGGTDLDLCVSYKDTKEFVDWMVDNDHGNVLSEF